MEREEQKLLDELKTVFAKEEDIIALYLFGSVTTAFSSARSDIDLAILLREPFNYRRPLALSTQASLILKRDEVDLLVLNSAPLSLGYRILQEGKLLLCTDELSLANFIESILQRYFDFKPDLESFYRDFQDSFQITYGTG